MNRPKLYRVGCCAICKHVNSTWDGNYTCRKYTVEVYGKRRPESVLPFERCGDYRFRQLDTWHNCDGKIGAYLRFSTFPPRGWNDNKSSWAIIAAVNAHNEAEYFPIKFCPVCGEKLEMPDA